MLIRNAQTPEFSGKEENTHEAQSTEHAVSAVDGSKPITHRRDSGG